jgi:hypothetical protein
MVLLDLELVVLLDATHSILIMNGRCVLLQNGLNVDFHVDRFLYFLKVWIPG